MAEYLLKYDQVDISYLQKAAVKQVSFTLDPGEILGIVGESGSGKSTLIKAAMGLLGRDGQVTGGEILYQGNNVLDLSKKERRKLNGPELGYIFQDAGSSFCPVRTVGAQLYEMVREHGRISKKDFQEQSLELFARLGFTDGLRILKSYPFELSGGMQQRAGIAAAMLLTPRILFADEPTSALDVSTQKQVVEEMQMIRKNFGTAIVFISHNLGVIEAVADRVLVMKNGEAVEYGEAKQVLIKPRDAYTQKLIEAVPRLRR